LPGKSWCISKNGIEELLWQQNDSESILMMLMMIKYERF